MLRVRLSSGLLLVAALSLSIRQTVSAFVDPDVVYLDKWIGWGSSLAWFGDILGGMPEDVQTEIISSLFSPDRLNLNILRYTIGGTIPGNYTCGPYRAGGATETFKDGPDSPYDWTRDPRGRKVLLAARDMNVDVFEAFSNSPPQWMTISGCSKGNDGNWPLHHNFEPENADIFADYLTEVVQHFKEEYNLTFSWIAPFNEPSSGYWPGTSGDQEGCCMTRPTMIAVTRSLYNAIQRKGMDTYTSVSVADETEMNVELFTQRNFTGEGVASMYTKVNTHGYLDFVKELRSDMYTLAQANQHTIWMDEWGWTGSPADDMSQGIIIADRIVTDIRVLNVNAWLYWQVMEDYGAWGLLEIPYNNATVPNIKYNSGYYAMLQFSKYIKRGYNIVHVNDPNTVAAYDPESQTLVLVVVNSQGIVHQLSYDLSYLSGSPEITATRTTPTEPNVDLEPFILTDDNTFPYTAPPYSVTTFLMKQATFASKPNLIVNGDFESPTKEGWSLQNETREDGGINDNYVYTGSLSGYLNLTESGLSLTQNVIAPATRSYYLTAKASSAGTDTKFGVRINGIQGPEVGVAILRGYQSYGLKFDAKEGDTISVYLSAPQSSTNNAQLENVILH